MKQEIYECDLNFGNDFWVRFKFVEFNAFECKNRPSHLSVSVRLECKAWSEGNREGPVGQK